MADSQTTTKTSRSLVKPFEGLFTKNTAILSVCILIAFILWLLNALSKEYEGHITVSVDYYNLPEDKVLVRDVQNNVQLRVRAVGFNLLWSELNLLTAEARINFANHADKEYVVVEDALANQLATTYTVLDAQPDTINFAFGEQMTRQVPVTLKRDISFAQQFYFADSVHVQPDSITLAGPKKIVDTIPSWPTVQMTETELDETIEREVALQEPSITSLELSRSEVMCRIPVEQFTEREMKVRISKRNVPQDVEVVILPNKVTLTFLVGLSKYENVSKDQFNVVADFSSINVQNNKQIDVEVRSNPSFVRNIRLTPETVNYMIYKL